MGGAVNKETRMRVLEEIERCDCPHFLILFRDSKLQFRGLYAYYPDTDEVFKIYGTGPRQVTDAMIERYYKYNSGGKKIHSGLVYGVGSLITACYSFRYTPSI